VGRPVKDPVKCRSCDYKNEVSGLLSANGDLPCAACGEYLFRISPTQILMLDRCPLSWYRKYVLGEDGPPPSFPMERGRRFHADVANLLNDAQSPLSFPAARKYVDQLPKPVHASEEKRRHPSRYGVIEAIIDVIDQHGTIREIKTGRAPESAPYPDHVFQVSLYAATEIWKNKASRDAFWSIDYVSYDSGHCRSFAGSLRPAQVEEIELTVENAFRTTRKYMALSKNEALGLLSGCTRCDWCRHL